MQGFLMMARPVRAAFQIAFAQPHAFEPAAHGRDMPGFGVVRGAGKGQFGRRNRPSVGGAALDQRQGLDRLDGGTRQDAHLGVAPLQGGLAGYIDHGDAAPVAAFHHRAARHLDQDRIARAARQIDRHAPAGVL